MSSVSVKRSISSNLASRIVLGLRKYDHIYEGLKSLRWLPFADKCFLLFYKCLNGRAPDYLLVKNFTHRLAHHKRNTRYKKELILPRCRLKTGQRSFVLRGATCWNRLPKDVNKFADCRIFMKILVNMFLKWLSSFFKSFIIS